MSKLTAFLSLNASAFAQGIKSARSSVKNLENHVRSGSDGMKGAFSQIGGAAKAGFATVAANATAAFTSISVAAKAAMDDGGRISDVMAQTGASGRNLIVLEQAFKNAGIAAEKVPRALGKMQRSIVQASEGSKTASASFAKLGIHAQDLVGKDAVESFRILSEAIAALPTPTQRAAAAMEIFGRSGADLMAVINDPSAWGEAADVASAYGEIIDRNADRFDRVSDALGNFNVLLKQAGAIAAETMLPQLEAMVALLPELARGMSMVSWGDMGLQNPFGRTGLRNPIVFDDTLTKEEQAGAGAMADQWAKDDPKHGRSRTEDAQASLDRKNDEFWARKEAEKQEEIAKSEEKARKEAEKKAEADRKKAEETAKSRAAALDAYKLEAQIIQARIEGNAEALAALEREKKIREEMAGLTQAGFTEQEARKDKLVSNAGSLGGYAQSMNVLFGRSANTGLLEENKRQTEWLRKIHDNTKPPKDTPKNHIPVFA
jgi:hypothetical protein